jgi:hypothetical protein
MLQESFGYECSVHGRMQGTLGSPIPDQIWFAISRRNIWPIDMTRTRSWDDDTLFDVIEFMFDQVSTGTDWAIAQTRLCQHFNVFNAAPARLEYRKRVNQILAQMGHAIELTVEGQVCRLPDTGMEVLLDDVTEHLNERDKFEVAGAIEKFHARTSGFEIRRDAVINLIGVFEGMRSDAKKLMLNKDEDALFNIANNFALRHNNAKQYEDYDAEVWLPWLFFLFLNAIYLVSHLMQRETLEQPKT